MQGLYCLSFCVSPGFHIGLCPHYTLGYAGVPPLQGLYSLSFWYTQGFISGFALITPWAMQECRPCRAYIPFRFVCPQGFILGFALIPPWAMQEFRPCRAYITFRFGIPRVSFRALPSFRPGFCRSGVSMALIMRLNFDAVALKQRLLNEWHKSFIFVLLIQYITKTNFF